MPPQDGYLFLDRARFRASFAADVAPDAAAFMADSQVPWGLEALDGARLRSFSVEPPPLSDVFVEAVR